MQAVLTTRNGKYMRPGYLDNFYDKFAYNFVLSRDKSILLVFPSYSVFIVNKRSNNTYFQYISRSKTVLKKVRKTEKNY